MSMLSSDRWLTLGSAITGVGATVSVGYWIYTLQAPGHPSFWELPGIASIILIVTGLSLLLIGFFAPTPTDPPRQHQQGDEGSTNLQAGRDIRISRDD
jgi:hypothetical protein